MLDLVSTSRRNVRTWFFHSGSGNQAALVADRAIRRGRMSIGFELPDRDAEMHPVYRAQQSQGVRVRRLEERRAQAKSRVVPLVSMDGVRGTVLVLVGLLLITGLGMWWAVDHSDIRAAAYRVNNLKVRISDVDRQCEALQQTYEDKAAALDVGYAAVDLGMISAKGMSLIYLYAPENALMTPFAASGTENMLMASSMLE